MKVVLLTGLSGAGKSTLSENVKKLLEKDSKKVFILDGDAVRDKYKQKLGFSIEDIKKNNYNILNICLSDEMKNFDFLFVPVIFPINEVRAEAREMLKDKYIEVFVKASINEVIKRDTKGLYKKAINGSLENMIGIDIKYEEPLNPDLLIDTENLDLDIAINKLYTFLKTY